MSWNIEWSPVASRDLLEIPWRTAAKVDASIMAFAAGRPHGATIERMTVHDPYRLRLRLRGAVALLWVEPLSRTLHVSRVFSGS
jgi:hypothetical protein